MRALIVILILGGNAFADEAPFGAKGQVVIDSGSRLAVTFQDIEPQDAGDGTEWTLVRLGASGDLFIADRVSVGIDAQYASADTDRTELGDWSVAPRLGFVLRMGPRLSLWPRVGARFAHHQDIAWSSNSVAVTAEVPLVVHLSPSFFIAAGPRVSADVWSEGTTGGGIDFPGPEVLDVGVAGHVGVVFGRGGDEVATRFGTKGQVVLRQETGIAFHHVTTTRDGVEGEPVLTTTAQVALDLFVADRLSAGVSVGVGHEDTAWQDTVGSTVAARFGYVVPLGERVSLWPGAQLAYRWYDLDPEPMASFIGARHQLVGLVAAPVLVHVTPRVFVGAGPMLSRTLWGDDPDDDAIEATILEVGVTSTIGGTF